MIPIPKDLYRACDENDISIVKQYLKEKRYTDSLGFENLLILSIGARHFEIADLMIKSGYSISPNSLSINLPQNLAADLNEFFEDCLAGETNKDTDSPDLSATKFYLNLMKEKKADVNFILGCETALDIALKYGNPEAIELIRKNGGKTKENLVVTPM